MMDAPRCEKHGRLVLDLALGRLDDDAAERGETARYDCPTCRAWWIKQMTSPAAKVVSTAVSTEFASFRVPRQRRPQRWWAMAAAVLLTLAALVLWQLAPGLHSDANRIETSVRSTISQPPQTIINSLSFEPETPTNIEIIKESEPEAAGSTVVASARRPDPPLFTGDFESGSLNGWNPST